VHLGVLDGDAVLCVESLTSLRALAVATRVGARAPMHTSSLGKVLLAVQPWAQVYELLQRTGLPRLTDHTIVHIETFRAHLAEVRVRGYAVNNEEEYLGVSCVAAPVWDWRGDVVAGISIAGVAPRFAGHRVALFGRAVIAAATEISQSLGYRAGALPHGSPRPDENAATSPMIIDGHRT
jgi:DNA-binding IclR family transcriptional regulator